MKTLNVIVKPKLYNSRRVEINFRGYDFSGLTFDYRVFNDADYPIDGGHVMLGGDDYQNWGPGTAQEDEEYIITHILKRLGLERDDAPPAKNEG